MGKKALYYVYSIYLVWVGRGRLTPPPPHPKIGGDDTCKEKNDVGSECQAGDVRGTSGGVGRRNGREHPHIGKMQMRGL